MKKNKVKLLAGCGAVSVLLLLISVWYSMTYNNSRLVVPMDSANDTFTVRDLPMIISIAFVCLYVICLCGIFFCAVFKRNQQLARGNVTRRLNPRLGYLGFLGLLGFAGFWTYHVDESIFPFAFFAFFGFFGFYYEGKMSGTFMDERFLENARRAQLSAFKITYAFMFVTLLVLCQGKLFGNLNYTLIAAVILLALALAMGIFFRAFLLYHYDHEEQFEESGE